MKKSGQGLADALPAEDSAIALPMAGPTVWDDNCGMGAAPLICSREFDIGCGLARSRRFVDIAEPFRPVGNRL